MPTLLLWHGYRFFIYSEENDEPAHIHVKKAEAEGKVWLEPQVQAEYFYGFSVREQRVILETVHEHADNFKKRWHEYFSSQ